MFKKAARCLAAAGQFSELLLRSRALALMRFGFPAASHEANAD
jgi:hypothetical protein